MKNPTNEKALTVVNQNSFLKNVKTFFKNLFKHRVDSTKHKPIQVQENPVSLESVKTIKDEETLLLKLQKDFDNYQIDAHDLTQEQQIALINLYEKQIKQIKKSNELQKSKLLQYRKK